MPLRENLFLDRMPAWSRDRPDLRGAQSALLARAQLLAQPDRMLVELAIKNHLTQRQLAQILSVPSGTVCRRLRRLITRLSDPLVIA
jgi:DNA-directed RNA polymerase specialized sigma subunit